MKKKMLASMMALGMMIPGVVATVHADEATAPQLMIKKVLNLPQDGVVTPTESFKFTFTKVSMNGKTDEELMKKIPVINEVSIAYTDQDKDDKDEATAGKQVIKTSADALANVTWPESGQYTYTVTETKGTTDAMTYSGASYTVSVFTKKDAQGNIVVDTIQIKKDKDDKGVAVENPTKTEYKPGVEGDGYKENNFSFSNNYDKKGGNNNPTPGGGGGTDAIPEADMSGFALLKTVKGDKINADEKFKFKLNATKPVGSHSEDNNFTYKIVSGSTVGNAVTVEYGKPFELELKHNDRVVFGDILLGSTVSAEEIFDAGYTKSLGEKTVFNGTAVTDLAALQEGKVIGNSGKNGVYFVNTQQTPTGIFMDNLPYIVVVAIAGLGLLFFITKRRDTEEA